MGITKICPSPAELCVIRTNIHCPEEGCTGIFQNSANLDMHLLKHHKKKHILKKDDGSSCQYHCPVEKCAYNIKSKYFFKRLKYLKQHYLKVHAEKTFRCDKCVKGFSTEAAMKHHSRICGIKFICSCNNAYDSYEALLTHAKRLSHSFDEKFKLYGKGLTDAESEKTKKTANSSVSQDHMAMSTIAVPVHFLAAVALSELSSKGTAVDIGVQTDEQLVVNKRTKKAPSPFKSCERAAKRRMSAQTQTGIVPRNKRPKISAQTQTIGDYILKKAMEDANISISCGNQKLSTKQTYNTKKRRKSMETQTMNHIGNKNKLESQQINDFINDSLPDFPSTSNMSLSTSSPSTYRLGVDVGLPDLWVGQKNSSGTQTSPIAMSALMEQEEILSHSVTQTDINLSFLESDTCEPSSSNIQSSSQTMHNLQRYFEDSSSCSFGREANSVTRAFEPELGTSSCRSNMETTLGTLADEPTYSPSQIDSFLGDRKLSFDVNRSCSIETQTELNLGDSFLSECTDDGDTSFTFCSTIETQTTEDFPSLDQLLYTNMCTQTCDDSLYSELGFVNIQTQTAWPQFGTDDSMFVSTETQTALSGWSSVSQNVNKPWSSKIPNSETSHMETQTDLDEFRQLIAELSKQSPDDKLL